MAFRHKVLHIRRQEQRLIDIPGAKILAHSPRLNQTRSELNRDYSDRLLVFVIPVIIAGVSLGLGPSLCSAILGALAFNFFLTEPRYTLAVDDPANIWAIGLLFVVGLIVSGVAFTSRQRATEAALLRRQASVLQDYSRDVVAADNTNAIVSITSQALAALFKVPVVVMLVTESTVVS